MVKFDHLSNGISVVGETNDFVRTISIGIWVKNGSIDETQETNGMSHFIEHMMFKGTQRRTARDIAEEMSEVGGRINAFTAKEYMCYYAHVLEEHFDVALDILADMICNSTFNEVDIEREKGVVIEEINMSEDSPEDLVNDILEEGTWLGTPLSLNILGTEDNVRGFTREKLLDYLKQHYVSENLVISVVGKMDFSQVLEKLEMQFKTVPSHGGIVRQTKMPYNKSFFTRHKDIEQTHLCMAFPSIAYNSEHVYTLTVLNTIVGGGLNSRLFQSIREEKGLTYSIYSYPESYMDCGLFMIYAAANPNQMEEVVESILFEIKKLLEEGVQEKELLRTKEQIKSNLIIGLESMNARMNNNGKSKLMLNRIKSQDEISEHISKVTTQSLLEFATKIIDVEKMSVSIVGDLEALNVERIEQLCKK